MNLRHKIVCVEIYYTKWGTIMHKVQEVLDLDQPTETP